MCANVIDMFVIVGNYYVGELDQWEEEEGFMEAHQTISFEATASLRYEEE